MKSFSRYLQLYTLHFVEQQTPNMRAIHVRLSTVRYLMTDLPQTLNQVWDADHNKGQALVESLTKQRIHTVIEDERVQQSLLATKWHPYATLRERHALPSTIIPTKALPSPTPFDRRLDQAERVLQIMKTGLEVANAGLVLWQTWQATRNERQQIFEAIKTTIVGQREALDHGNAKDFIEGYLASHKDDPVHPLLFDSTEEQN